MENKTVGIIHTTSATVGNLDKLVEASIPGIQVINILDDSILNDMKTGHAVDYVRERWIGYARNLEEMGVCAVLSACSTVGGFAEEADQLLDIPVYRIDEAMALKAVEKGEKIGVFATLQSTLNPTVDIIRRKAAQNQKEVEIETVLVDGAYDVLMSGDRAGHDRRIAEAVSQKLDSCDVIVLAQASMANALTQLKGAKEKVLTSPKLGVEKLKNDLKSL